MPVQYCKHSSRQRLVPAPQHAQSMDLSEGAVLTAEDCFLLAARAEETPGVVVVTVWELWWEGWHLWETCPLVTLPLLPPLTLNLVC